MKAAGEAVGEPVWHMPLVTDYADDLQSDVADVANTSRTPGVGPLPQRSSFNDSCPRCHGFTLTSQDPPEATKLELTPRKGQPGMGLGS